MEFSRRQFFFSSLLFTGLASSPELFAAALSSSPAEWDQSFDIVVIGKAKSSEDSLSAHSGVLNKESGRRHGLAFSRRTKEIEGHLWEAPRPKLIGNGPDEIRIVVCNAPNEEVFADRSIRILSVIREKKDEGKILGLLVDVEGKPQKWKITKGLMTQGTSERALWQDFFEGRKTGADMRVLCGLRTSGAVTTGMGRTADAQTALTASPVKLYIRQA